MTSLDFAGCVDANRKAADCKPGCILDGFPRAGTQAEALEEVFSEQARSLNHVVSIEVPEEELVRRLTGRRSCPKCGAI